MDNDNPEEYLNINAYQFSFETDGSKIKSDKIPIETHPCTVAELGLDNSNTSKFYPMSEV